uniref:Uncharacterized protein n=1 Tax=Arundo donax TaxID=35708 RepID=A0A0A9A9Z8_ARUDO
MAVPAQWSNSVVVVDPCFPVHKISPQRILRCGSNIAPD